MESLLFQVVGNAAALGTVLAFVWWRIGQLEKRLCDMDKLNRETHEKMWTQITDARLDVSNLKGRLGFNPKDE